MRNGHLCPLPWVRPSHPPKAAPSIRTMVIYTARGSHPHREPYLVAPSLITTKPTSTRRPLQVNSKLGKEKKPPQQRHLLLHSSISKKLPGCGVSKCWGWTPPILIQCNWSFQQFGQTLNLNGIDRCLSAQVPRQSLDLSFLSEGHN